MVGTGTAHTMETGEAAMNAWLFVAFALQVWAIMFSASTAIGRRRGAPGTPAVLGRAVLGGLGVGLVVLVALGAAVIPLGHALDRSAGACALGEVCVPPPQPSLPPTR